MYLFQELAGDHVPGHLGLGAGADHRQRHEVGHGAEHAGDGGAHDTVGSHRRQRTEREGGQEPDERSRQPAHPAMQWIGHG